MGPKRGAAAGLLQLTACGGGTIANEDLPLGTILIILAIAVVGLLFAIYMGTKGK